MKYGILFIGQAVLSANCPADKTAPLRDILNLSMVTPITQKEIFDSIRGDFADESPNKRISAIERLKHLDKKEANLLVEEALKDEPDKLIQKQLKKYLIQDAQRK